MAVLLNRSPIMDVYWAGWSADTYTLQRNGWEMAIHEDHFGDRLRAMFHDPRCGIVLHAQTREPFHPQFQGYQTFEAPRQQLHVQQATHRDRTMVYSMPQAFAPLRVDARPDFIEVTKSRWDMSAVFRPWNEGKEELIVRPESVNELMDRIRQLQEPELKAIRERNRAREMRDRPVEQICAQIISIAA